MLSGRRTFSLLALCGLALVAAPAPAAADELAVLYRDTQLGGTTLSVSQDLPNLAAVGFNDAASSIKLTSDQPIAVYQHASFTGPCLTVRGNVGRLSDTGFGNDNISSVRIAWTCEQGAYEVDACLANPCGAGFLCADLPRPAPTGWSGRTCTPDGPTPESLTVGKPVRQSSTAFGGEASRAVDGRTDGVWGASSVTSTGLEAGWLEIDLGAAREIGLVALHNRTDCCAERLIGVRLELTLDPCDRADRRVIARGDPVTTAAATHVRAFEPKAVARYLCVRHDRAQYLSLAEVQAFAGWEPPMETSIGKPGVPMTDGPTRWVRNRAYTVRMRRAVRVKQLTWTANVAPSHWVEARVWDEAGALVAKGVSVFGTGETSPLALPIDVTLEGGRTYQIGFYAAEPSAFPRAVYSFDGSGLLKYEPWYTRDFVVAGAVSASDFSGSSPPLTPNAFAPELSITYCATFVCR